MNTNYIVNQSYQTVFFMGNVSVHISKPKRINQGVKFFLPPRHNKSTPGKNTVEVPAFEDSGVR